MNHPPASATPVDQLLTETQAADRLRLSARTLQNWRLRGGGPPFVKCGARSVRYSQTSLLDWLNDNSRSSTSDRGR